MTADWAVAAAQSVFSFQGSELGLHKGEHRYGAQV